MAGGLEQGAGDRGPGDRGPDAPATDAVGLADVLAVAGRAGLALSAEDAERLVTAARRVRAMAAEVRLLAGPDVEPSGPSITPWPARTR